MGAVNWSLAALLIVHTGVFFGLIFYQRIGHSSENMIKSLLGSTKTISLTDTPDVNGFNEWNKPLFQGIYTVMPNKPCNKKDTELLHFDWMGQT